jgi:hypothetical protein
MSIPTGLTKIPIRVALHSSDNFDSSACELEKSRRRFASRALSRAIFASLNATGICSTNFRSTGFCFTGVLAADQRPASVEKSFSLPA